MAAQFSVGTLTCSELRKFTVCTEEVVMGDLGPDAKILCQRALT